MPKGASQTQTLYWKIETIISVKLESVGIGIGGLMIFGMMFSMVLGCAMLNS